MDNRILGVQLKAAAKPRGNFVKVEISNMWNTAEALSHFFYMKKHEWIAICFFDSLFFCRLIWFNKGQDHTSVPLGITPEQALQVGGQNHTRYILIAHNHPVSSHDMPDYGSRSANIEASYQQKRNLLGFSDADLALRDNWRNALLQGGIVHADAVFVAGTYTMNGDESIIGNYNDNKPKKACFVSTCVYGPHGHETRILRTYRDNVLSKTSSGRLFCRIYYAVGPAIVMMVRNNRKLRKCCKFILDRIVSSLNTRHH